MKYDLRTPELGNMSPKSLTLQRSKALIVNPLPLNLNPINTCKGIRRATGVYCYHVYE